MRTCSATDACRARGRRSRPGQRERDIRRDAALATLGYLTVRFSHLRLHADPEGCIEELLAILAARRAQFGLRPA